MPSLVPLSTIKPLTKVVVYEVGDDLGSTKPYLQSLGIAPSNTITVIQADRRGIKIRVFDSTLTLDYETAFKIIVTL